MIDGIAKKRAVSRAEALRRSILLLAYLSKKQADGAEITIKDTKTGKTYHLIMEGSSI
jgi:hypothetical protein